MKRRGKKIPVRMCAACGRRASQTELLRLVISGKMVVRDPVRRQPGRGAYVCPQGGCLEALASERPSKRIFRRDLGPEAWDGLLSLQI